MMSFMKSTSGQIILVSFVPRKVHFCHWKLFHVVVFCIGNPNLNGIAMALSGFTQQRNTLWCEMCSSLRQNLRHPYLRAMFGFLTACDDTYDAVLVSVNASVIFQIIH